MKNFKFLHGVGRKSFYALNITVNYWIVAQSVRATNSNLKDASSMVILGITRRCVLEKDT